MTTEPLYKDPFYRCLLYVLVGIFFLYANSWFFAPFLDSDSLEYFITAQDLADGSLDQLNNRAPGYPLLLVLTGSTLIGFRTLYIMQLIAHFLCIAMLVPIAKQLAMPKW